jgi:hypothetical protein
MSRQFDGLDWYICTLHEMLGHNSTAAYLGQPPGDRDQCILCQFEAGKVTRADVERQLGVG